MHSKPPAAMSRDEMLFVARFDAEPYDIERRHVAPPKHKKLKLRCFLIACKTHRPTDIVAKAEKFFGKNSYMARHGIIVIVGI
jgi:hypothetical protein